MTNVLLGPASLDRYVAQGVVLPGGGALNMAYHWSRFGLPFHFLTRIGDDDPRVFTTFLRRWHIAHSPSIVGAGASASIDIVIDDDRQPRMDHFVEGVWTGFRLTDDEVALVASARRMHVVMVDATIAEIARLGAASFLDDVDVSADFLSFRHVDLQQFEATLAHVQIAFVGWPGEIDDPVMVAVREVVRRTGRRAVITLGSRGVLVIDDNSDDNSDDNGNGERFVPVEAVAVTGTTVGCGDAFIAAFLAHWWAGGSMDSAVEAGKRAGATATTWLRPLPDEAYEV